jgi:hypothetical protein
MVSVRSCSEAKKSRLIAEASQRAYVLPVERYVRCIVDKPGTANCSFISRIKNVGSKPTIDLQISKSYRIGAGEARSLPAGNVQPLEAGQEAEWYDVLNLTSEDLELLRNPRTHLRVYVHMQYIDALTQSLIRDDSCFEHQGEGFASGIGTIGTHILTLVSCDNVTP